MKRLMMLLLAGVVAVSLTACGENTPKAPTPATDEAQPAATTDTSAQPATEAAPAPTEAAPAAPADAVPADATPAQ